MERRRVLVYCDYAKKEIPFLTYPDRDYPDVLVVECPFWLAFPKRKHSCRGVKGCALYEKFWFDGSIANKEQQKILREAHRKGIWEKLMDEWLRKKYARKKVKNDIKYSVD